jgi:TonB family protein
MQILHIRYNGSLLSQLAAQEERRQQIVRLRSDKPTDVQISHRSKRPEFDLKVAYPRRILQSVAAAAILIGGVLFYNPEKALTVGSGKPKTVVMSMEHIPETTQKALPPAPPRPVVPIAVEGEEVPDSVTIEPTDLDLDALPIDLSLIGPGGPIGPVADEPMNIGDIDYKPHLLTLIMPAFPEQARKAKLKQGTARVKLLVDKKGKVESVEFVTGPPLFKGEAISTAYRYRFRPGKHQGEVRKVWMEVSIQFKYD